MINYQELSVILFLSKDSFLYGEIFIGMEYGNIDFIELFEDANKTEIVFYYIHDFLFTAITYANNANIIISCIRFKYVIFKI